jgi:hypothetical protein
MVVSAAIAATFLFAFFIGFSMGGSYVRRASDYLHVLHYKDSKQLAVRIIRSGERGYLFVDVGGKVQFINSEEISSISRR